MTTVTIDDRIRFELHDTADGQHPLNSLYVAKP